MTTTWGEDTFISLAIVIIRYLSISSIMLYTLNIDNFYFKNTLKKRQCVHGESLQNATAAEGWDQETGQSCLGRGHLSDVVPTKAQKQRKLMEETLKEPNRWGGGRWELENPTPTPGFIRNKGNSQANSPEIEPLVTAREERVAVPNPADNQGATWRLQLSTSSSFPTRDFQMLLLFFHFKWPTESTKLRKGKE